VTPSLPKRFTHARDKWRWPGESKCATCANGNVGVVRRQHGLHACADQVVSSVRVASFGCQGAVEGFQTRNRRQREKERESARFTNVNFAVHGRCGHGNGPDCAAVVVLCTNCYPCTERQHNLTYESRTDHRVHISGTHHGACYRSTHRNAN
jgi:hypothetical protein